MALNIGLAANAVKTALDKVFMQEFDVVPAPGYASAEDPAVFRQDSTDRNAVITEQIQGPGYFQTRAEQATANNGTIRVGNQKTSSVLNYANDVDISKNFFDDDQHNVVTRAIELLARNARLTRDRNAFATYNLGYSSQQTNDAVAFFSNSHTTLGGQTVDNLETGTLTEANLEVAINSLLEQRTQDGTAGGHEPAVLLVPTALLKEANIIAKSELRSGTGNNDLNYYSTVFPGLQVKWSPFLGATLGNTGSDVRWILLGRNHSVTRFVRAPLLTDLVDWRYQANRNYRYIAEYREVVDVISFEGAVGSNGTV